MPSASFGGGAVRVRTPGSYDASEGHDRGDRDLGDGSGRTAAKSALLAALAEQDFDVVDRIDLTPRRSRDLESPGPANRRGTVALDVDVAPGDDAVVLLERDGVYSWHLPAAPHRGDAVAGTPHRVLRDHRPASEAARPRPPGASGQPQALGAEQRHDRGLLGDLVHGAVQAIVLRFAVPVVVGRVVRRLEEPVRPGLVHVAGPSAASWQPVAAGATLALPTDRPVRVLLLVHGTFSSTVGAFAPMGLVPGAEGFLPTVLSAYDAVIGYDHRTLSVDPRQNADDLLAELRRHHPGTDLTIDIITHSRGGLVTRSFVEAVLPQSNWPATVDHVIFVASTHGGTHLADPARWHDLVDLYTNLVTVGAAGLALVPGGAPVAAVVGGVVRGIGALVKHLVSYAAEGDDVPGLAAMIPGGPFVTELNREQPGQPGSGHEVARRVVQLPRQPARREPPAAGVPQGARRAARRGFRRRALRGRQRPRRRHGLDERHRPGVRRLRQGRPRLRHERRGLPHELLRPDARHRGDRRLAATGHGSGRGPRDRRSRHRTDGAHGPPARNVRRS